MGDTLWGCFVCGCMAIDEGTYVDENNQEIGSRTDGYCVCGAAGVGGIANEIGC